MKWIIGIMLLSMAAFAEPEYVNPELQNISKSGKLITLNVAPSEKTLMFSIVGKPTLSVDLSNAQIHVLVLEKNKKRPLGVSRISKGKYVSEAVTPNQPMKMEVQVKLGDETEKFDVSLPQR